ncbi:hypothetical protein [uncultured Phascolarctobacterium sp.]|uniref:hypothetical protein n=1 Tax=uncultured Phascolarctobacterium sp. TaxID=512296 RepID=UPI0025CD2F5A|nr:hypothetical protein [uncultured Phascolarctobacterium sp.]
MILERLNLTDYLKCKYPEEFDPEVIKFELIKDDDRFICQTVTMKDTEFGTKYIYENEDLVGEYSYIADFPVCNTIEEAAEILCRDSATLCFFFGVLKKDNPHKEFRFIRSDK